MPDVAQLRSAVDRADELHPRGAAAVEAKGSEAPPAAVDEAAPAAPVQPGVTYFDPVERVRQKQAARDQDAADLASGRKTQEQLHRENSWLHGLRFRVDLAGAKRLW